MSWHSIRLQALRLRAMAWLMAALLPGLAGCGGDKSDAGHREGSHEAAQHDEAGKTGHADEGLKLSAEEARRAGLKLETLAPQAFADTVTVTATIRPNQDRIARVSPRIEGRIVQVNASLGAQVQAGQTLALLDSPAIGEAQAALLLAQANQRLAQADFKRAESLVAEEIIAQRDFLRARAELEKANAELRAAQDKLRLLGGSLRGDATANASFALAAPLAGTVVQKQATVGELATPAAALFTVADLSKLWVEAHLTEDLLSKVRVGAAAMVSVAAYPGQQFAGRVGHLASQLDKDSRTVAARIEVDNRDGRLKPEMFATVAINIGANGRANTGTDAGTDAGNAQRSLLAVPDAAILLLQGQPTIFVQTQGGYEARAVELGEKVAGRTEIKSGAAAGEQVVIAGAYALKARLLKSQIGDTH